MEEPYEKTKQIIYAGIVLGVAAVLTGVALSGGEKIPKDFTVSYDGSKRRILRRASVYMIHP